MKDNWTIRIIDKGYTFYRDVYVFARTLGGANFVCGDTIEFVPEGTEPPKPSFRLDPEQLQALADELAQVGYKPQKGFVEGELIATKSHLADMRQMLKLK